MEKGFFMEKMVGQITMVNLNIHAENAMGRVIYGW